jgi:type I restriction enzyme S subunit
MTVAWQESTIGDQFEVQLGKRLDAAVNRGTLKRCVNNRGVRWGRVSVAESVLAPLTEQDINDLRLVAGDVLVCEGGEIGRASVWNDELPEAYFLNTLHRLRSRGDYKPQLLAAFLEHFVGTGSLSALVGKSSLAHLTKEKLLQVPLPVPSPEEQSGIVRTLASADKAINAVERLIAKKQAIKIGMVQQLLTGKTRLPGFNAPWKTLRLVDLVSIKSGQVDPKKPEHRDLPLIAPDHVESATGRLLKLETAKAQGAISGKYPAGPGDIIYSKIRPYLKKAVRVNFLALCSADMYPLTPQSGVDGAFVLHLLLSEKFTNFAVRVSARSGIPKINRIELAEFTLQAPDLSEQQAISTKLNSIDEQVLVLEKWLVKQRAIKQGMMQQLLTGRTRLPAVEGAE